MYSTIVSFHYHITVGMYFSFFSCVILSNNTKERIRLPNFTFLYRIDVSPASGNRQCNKAGQFLSVENKYAI